MSDNNKEENKEKAFDFTTNSTFQKSIKIARRKQTVKFLIISSVSTVVILFFAYQGASILLENSLESYDEDILYSEINGANMYIDSASFNHKFLSINSQLIVKKRIGDREIIWDKVEDELTLFERKSNNGLVTVQSPIISDRLNRPVLYNEVNGEKEALFYYPEIEYDFLPKELDILSDLEENQLLEVSLSFDKGYTINEVEEALGYENVEWLWINTENQEKSNNTSNKRNSYLYGNSAKGFLVYDEFTGSAEAFLRNIKKLSESKKYQSIITEITKSMNEESFPSVSDIRITGAIVTGTPEELSKFKEIDIIRGSTIGATIDLY